MAIDIHDAVVLSIVDRTLHEIWTDQPGVLTDAAFEPGSCRQFYMGYAWACLRRAGIPRPGRVEEVQAVERLLVRRLADFMREHQ